MISFYDFIAFRSVPFLCTSNYHPFWFYLQWRAMMLPDRYIDHGSPQDQLEAAGLSSKHIAATVLSLIERPKEALLFK